MKAILMAGTMLAMMGTANSASFYRGQIIGKINYGDEKEFNAMVATYPPKTKIYLNSPGGNVTAGLAIAATIQALALDTVVDDRKVCASICGIIWLAGSMRWVSESASIGFHGAYDGQTGERSPQADTAIARFLAGRYSVEALAYLRQAPPEGMKWLRAAKAVELGITSMVFPSMAFPSYH